MRLVDYLKEEYATKELKNLHAYCMWKNILY